MTETEVPNMDWKGYHDFVESMLITDRTDAELLTMCAMGVVGELGEVCEVIDGCEEYPFYSNDGLIEELGGTLFYCCAVTILSNRISGLAGSSILPEMPERVTGPWIKGVHSDIHEILMKAALICEASKKHSFHGKRLPTCETANAAGHIIWSLQSIASRHGDIPMIEIARANAAKLIARHGGARFDINRVDHGKAAVAVVTP